MKENKPTNETGKNPETEQEKEVLPSFFQTLKTSTSKPLPNREVLEYNIMHSAPVKTNTEGYRSMTKVDKRTAEDIKHRLPCITPSVQLKGSSKKLTDFRKETYWLMLDYDDVPPKTSRHSGRKPGKSPSPWSSTSPSRARDSASCSDICGLKDAISLPPNSTSSPYRKP